MFKLILLFICIFAVSCRPSGSTNTSNSTAQNNRILIFDIPSLLNKNIDEIMRDLGKRNSAYLTSKKKTQSTDLEQDEEIYTKEGYQLIVSYQTKTRVVFDFYIQPKEKFDKTNGFTAILQSMNLDIHHKQYTIIPIIDRADETCYKAFTVARK